MSEVVKDTLKFVVGLFSAIALFVFLVFVTFNLVGKYSCNQFGQLHGLPTSYVWADGCFVEEYPGKWTDTYYFKSRDRWVR